jgi:hypothetical protein
MNKEQIQKLDDLTLMLNFDLAVLNSATQDDNLEIYMLNPFVEKIYKDSEEIRTIFDNEF